jgi:hypothetical protein
MGWGDHSDGHDRSFGNTSLASFDEWKLASFCETVSQPQLASFGEAARAVHGKVSFYRYELSKSGGQPLHPYHRGEAGSASRESFGDGLRRGN